MFDRNAKFLRQDWYDALCSAAGGVPEVVCPFLQGCRQKPDPDCWARKT